jgi:hypothetical protein
MNPMQGQHRSERVSPRTQYRGFGFDMKNQKSLNQSKLHQLLNGPNNNPRPWNQKKQGQISREMISMTNAPNQPVMATMAPQHDGSYMLKTTNQMLVPNSRNVEGGGLAVQGQNYSHAVNYSGPGILGKSTVDTRNMIKHHKPSNSLGNAQVVNRIMYPITQVNTNVGNSNYNSHHGSVNSS